METISEHSIQTVNDIAGSVVMLEPDDIQALGEILKKINSLEEEPVQDYINQVGDIVERLILDEYESAEVGIEELNSAVDQLQIAIQSEGHISGDELEEKRRYTEQNDEMEASDDEPEKEIIMEPEAEAEQEPDVGSENGQSTATTVEEQQKPESAQEIPEEKEEVDEQPEPEAESPEADLVAEEEEEESIHQLFEESDDPEVINRTLEEDPELVQGFIQESEENLQMIENGMIQLESNPDDLSLIDSIFRPFHTVKGVAGFLNLNDINALAHGFENMLDDARKGELEFNDAVSEVVFEGIDALRVMISKLAESQKKGEYVPHGLDLDYFANIIEDARKGQKTKRTRKDTPQEPKGKKGKKSSPKNKGGKSLSEMASSATSSFERTERSVKVSTSKMDSLLDLVGELVVTQNMVMQNTEIQNSSDKRLQQDIGQLKRITSSLQDLSMSLRMVPIKEIFQKMHRIVRDLSRKKGKKIVLETHGEETEIDRNMVDELYEPLVHMIRNNCDHGLEYPEERRAAGKPETGKVILNAYYKGGMVIIEVADDGRGINVDKIRERAVNRGLMSEDEQLSESQILNFIFSSGFSTAEEVTDVSGRGVGMDVVKKAINRLRGSVEIKTKQGEGTSFSLKLPLTLAIIDGVVVRVGSERLIIPTTGIKESLVLEEGNYNKIAGKGETVFIRDRIVPLLRVDDFFGIEGAERDPTQGVLIVVESENREAAIIVDEMLDKQEIVIKSLGESLNKIQGLSGGAIMPDGNVGLIIDVPTLLPKSKMSFKNAE